MPSASSLSVFSRSLAGADAIFALCSSTFRAGAALQVLNILSHHLAAISMAAVYTDAAHIADGVIGLKQRSLAANDPTE